MHTRKVSFFASLSDLRMRTKSTQPLCERVDSTANKLTQRPQIFAANTDNQTLAARPTDRPTTPTLVKVSQ